VCTFVPMSIDWPGIWQMEQPPLETMVRASIVYLAVHVLLRLAGRKELSRYSSFDLAVIFLVTVAVRRAITVDDASVSTAVLALATLIGWNVLFSWLSFRSQLAARLLKGSPRLLVRDGRPLEDALRESRIGLDELKARLRVYGTQELGEVHEAYLETDGKLTFVFRTPPVHRRTA
jgi:uncharacterized membrane protein YcaP (DUF421 family)